MSLKDDLPKPLHPLSSSPPIMQSLTLPVEVVEGVVDCCSGDATTLLAFSLTCRDIHPRSILVLYTHVELEDRDQLFDFCDALKAKPERQPIVQSLLIYGEDFAPYPLLSMLPALRHIKFEGGGEQSILQWYPSTLLCCRRSGSSIRNLTIRDYTFSTCTAFLRILSAFPTIENLACMSLYVEKKGEANPLVQKSLSRQLRLRTLNVSVSTVVSV
ncbi:hypothetical protein BD309DRAFT_876163 [Dichomitus squalens]|nr:hypothetical protein BD309DRAFT_876163 [Dichomitus squalens]TBU52149.1 hypothetical protein BD310DRAFT_832829 [Dichomitus squalens]